MYGLNPISWALIDACAFRQQSAGRVFALYLFGSKYNILWTPASFNAIFKTPSDAISSVEARWSLLRNVFGAGTKCEKDYLRIHKFARAAVQNGLYSPTATPSSLMMQTTLRGIQEHAPSLVSFSDSVVDQNLWERTAYPATRGSAVEISLSTLIRNFIGHVSLPSLVGSEFLEIYPTTLDDLWHLDGGFKWLALGVPRWLGIPALTRAHIGRRRLLDAVRSFHQALDCVEDDDPPNRPWRDPSDAGRILKERRWAYRSRGTPQEVIGPLDLSLLWA